MKTTKIANAADQLWMQWNSKAAQEGTDQVKAEHSFRLKDFSIEVEGEREWESEIERERERIKLKSYTI